VGIINQDIVDGAPWDGRARQQRARLKPFRNRRAERASGYSTLLSCFGQWILRPREGTRTIPFIDYN